MPAAKPTHSSGDEQRLMSELWSPVLADDPYAFVMFAYPWGVPNTPLAGKKGPRRWQKRLLTRVRDHIAQNKAIGAEFDLRRAIGLISEDEEPGYKVHRAARSSGRGPGKSAVVSWLAHWFISTRLGSTTTISANTENQLRTVTWGEMSKWFTMAINAHWFDIAATKITPRQWLTDLVERDLKKGTRYWAVEGKLWSEENPDGYAGIHNHDGMLLIFDEASGIADAIWPVAEGFFTEPVPDRYWFAFSNPRRSTGAFFECFHAKREYWDAEYIDVREVEGTDKAVYQQIIDQHGEDSYQAHVEVYGTFPPSGSGHFIAPSLVDAAVKRPAYDDPTAPIIVGIDPSRGGDNTAIAVRQGRDLLEVITFKSRDTMAVVGRVIEVMEKYNPTLTVIDEGGLGYGVLDRLTEQRYKVRGVNFGWKSSNDRQWANKKAEMWDKMRDWLRTAHLPNDKTLRTDLTTPNEVDPTSLGGIQIEAKKAIRSRGGASPDCFVAGTMVSTPSGSIPIEHVCEGDIVSTPVGPRTVIRTWVSETDSVTTARFSDGRNLSGKGNHTVFTWDAGWVRLDALSLENEIETNDPSRRMLWKLHRLWFTKVKSSGFKHQVGITNPGEKMRRKDFFIAESGLITSALSRKIITSITSTVIGRIIALRIWSVSMGEIISRNTLASAWLPLKGALPASLDFPTERKRLDSGTPVPRGSNGTPSTGKRRGWGVSLLKRFASSVVTGMRRFSQIAPASVRWRVSNTLHIDTIKRRVGCVFGAVLRSFSTNTGSRNVVPVSVQISDVRPTLVYNLTLDRDNVYYANGILVSNCADAVSVTFAFPVAHREQDRKRDSGRSRAYSPAMMSTSWMGS